MVATRKHRVFRFPIKRTMINKIHVATSLLAARSQNDVLDRKTTARSQNIKQNCALQFCQPGQLSNRRGQSCQLIRLSIAVAIDITT